MPFSVKFSRYKTRKKRRSITTFVRNEKGTKSSLLMRKSRCSNNLLIKYINFFLRRNFLFFRIHRSEIPRSQFPRNWLWCVKRSESFKTRKVELAPCALIFISILFHFTSFYLREAGIKEKVLYKHANGFFFFGGLFWDFDTSPALEDTKKAARKAFSTSGRVPLVLVKLFSLSQ